MLLPGMLGPGPGPAVVVGLHAQLIAVELDADTEVATRHAGFAVDGRVGREFRQAEHRVFSRRAAVQDGGQEPACFPGLVGGGGESTGPGWRWCGGVAHALSCLGWGFRVLLCAGWRGQESATRRWWWAEVFLFLDSAGECFGIVGVDEWPASGAGFGGGEGVAEGGPPSAGDAAPDPPAAAESVLDGGGRAVAVVLRVVPLRLRGVLHEGSMDAPGSHGVSIRLKVAGQRSYGGSGPDWGAGRRDPQDAGVDCP